MNYREKIRKAIECPQFGNKYYGEWGCLNFTQRKDIKRLLDELDRVDNYLKKIDLENKQLKDNWNKQKEIIDKAIEYIQNHQLVCKGHTTEEIDEWFNQFYVDVMQILKEVSE